VALSVECVSAHVQKWEQTLSVTSYSHRRHWPSRLFRHEPLENIVPILLSGQLLSRNAAALGGAIVNDIAPVEIINACHAAHDSVRLYFRPRTPTQYHIEGIREPADFYQGKHAPILYMMVFDAVRVLTAGGVRFSGSNMQGNPPVYDDDAHFNTLDFADIYHEGSIPGDDVSRIVRARCAEVLYPGSMPLLPYLSAVICRSAAERQLLLHQLGPLFPNRERIRVFNEAGLFNADFAFVESVDLASDGIHVQFHSARRGAGTGAVEVRLYRYGAVVPLLRWEKHALEFWKKWQFSGQIAEGRYLIEIYVRGCLAYRAEALLEGQPF
jgi:hypothetical protein